MSHFHTPTRFRGFGIHARWLVFSAMAAGLGGGCQPTISPSKIPSNGAPPSSPSVSPTDRASTSQNRSPDTRVVRLRDPFTPLPPAPPPSPDRLRGTPWVATSLESSAPSPSQDRPVPVPPLPRFSSAPPGTRPVAVAPPSSVDLPTPADPPRLVGTVRGIRQLALLRLGDRMHHVAPGQVVGGWLVESIGDGTAVVSRDGAERRRLALGTPVRSADAGSLDHPSTAPPPPSPTPERTPNP
jgi:hypothetical protein